MDFDHTHFLNNKFGPLLTVYRVIIHIYNVILNVGTGSLDVYEGRYVIPSYPPYNTSTPFVTNYVLGSNVNTPLNVNDEEETLLSHSNTIFQNAFMSFIFSELAKETNTYFFHWTFQNGNTVFTLLL